MLPETLTIPAPISEAKRKRREMASVLPKSPCRPFWKSKITLLNALEMGAGIFKVPVTSEVEFGAVGRFARWLKLHSLSNSEFNFAYALGF